MKYEALFSVNKYLEILSAVIVIDTWKVKTPIFFMHLLMH